MLKSKSVGLRPFSTRGWASGTLLALLAIAMTAGIQSRAVQADEAYTFIIKKQEDKAKTRWSLAEWLETRDRMRLMDLWLALHSPSPYEFFVGGGYQFDEEVPGGRFQAFGLEAGAYASIFGLQFKYDSSLQDPYWEGQFNLRIFGYHDQGTNITLHAGLRTQTSSAAAYRIPYAGFSMSVYLAKFVGVGGLYRYAFSSTPTPSGISVNGYRVEGNAFIEFKFLRFYGGYFYEPMDNLMSRGVNLGARFYF